MRLWDFPDFLKGKYFFAILLTLFDRKSKLIVDILGKMTNLSSNNTDNNENKSICSTFYVPHTVVRLKLYHTYIIDTLPNSMV